MQLHQNYAQFEAKDTEIVTIGPENQIKFRQYFEDNGFEFYGLADEKLSVLKLYGQKVNLFKLGWMLAQMLVDKDGILRYIHYGHSMKDIPENQEMLELIDAL